MLIGMVEWPAVVKSVAQLESVFLKTRKGNFTSNKILGCIIDLNRQLNDIRVTCFFSIKNLNNKLYNYAKNLYNHNLKLK